MERIATNQYHFHLEFHNARIYILTARREAIVYNIDCTRVLPDPDFNKESEFRFFLLLFFLLYNLLQRFNIKLNALLLLKYGNLPSNIWRKKINAILVGVNRDGCQRIFKVCKKDKVTHVIQFNNYIVPYFNEFYTENFRELQKMNSRLFKLG